MYSQSLIAGTCHPERHHYMSESTSIEGQKIPITTCDEKWRAIFIISPSM
jgi:hypothetical protein